MQNLLSKQNVISGITILLICILFASILFIGEIQLTENTSIRINPLFIGSTTRIPVENDNKDAKNYEYDKKRALEEFSRITRELSNSIDYEKPQK